MTFEEFMRHASDAAYMGNEDLLRGYAREVFVALDKLRAERDEARGDAERIRQKAIVAQSERDHARVEFKMLQYRLEAAGKIISENGCDCDCDHDVESHDADCERCLACRISDALWPEVSE
jgi:hypothetical protein